MTVPPVVIAANRSLLMTRKRAGTDHLAAEPDAAPPQEAVAAIATELQELATRAQSLLSKLADSGLLTTEQVTEQKRRFLS